MATSIPCLFASYAAARPMPSHPPANTSFKGGRLSKSVFKIGVNEYSQFFNNLAKERCLDLFEPTSTR